MDTNSIPIILSLLVLVACSAFFSSTETAFSSVNRLKLKNLANNGDERAQRALKLADNYDELISAILIGNNIVNILSSSLATVVFVRFFGDAGVTLSTVVMTVLILIFGEISPKTVGKANSLNVCMRFAPIISACIILFKPLTLLFGTLQRALSERIRPEDDGQAEEELLTMVDEAEHEGDLGADESELIRSAIEFYDIDAGDILTPRVDVEGIDVTDSMEEVDRRFKETGFSRLPVYEGTIDNVLGILHEKDFNLRQPGATLTELISDPVCVMPNTKLSALLKRLQREKNHMAIVVDEYGGMEGIITLEDILEELVGEIWDEHDEVVEDLRQLPDGSLRVMGSAALEDLFERFDLEKEVEQFESTTVSGWVIEQLGQIPNVGDRFDYGQLHVTVEKMEARRVLEVRVEVRKPDPDGQTAH